MAVRNCAGTLVHSGAYEQSQSWIIPVDNTSGVYVAVWLWPTWVWCSARSGRLPVNGVDLPCCNTLEYRLSVDILLYCCCRPHRFFTTTHSSSCGTVAVPGNWYPGARRCRIRRTWCLVGERGVSIPLIVVSLASFSLLISRNSYLVPSIVYVLVHTILLCRLDWLQLLPLDSGRHPRYIFSHL